MSSDRKTFLAHALQTYGTQLVLLPLSLTASALQARLIGPTGRGQVAILLASVGFGSLLLGLGISSSVTFHVSSGQLTPGSLRPLLSRFLIGATALLVGIAAVLHLLGYEQWLIGSLPPAAGLVALTVLFALALINGWLTAVLSARRAFPRINRAALFAGLIPTTVYAIALAIVGRREVASAGTLSFVLGTMVSVELLRCGALSFGVTAVEQTSPPPSAAPHLKGLLAYSLLAYACDTIQYFTYRADVWVMKANRPEAELGHYSLAVTLAEMTLLAAGAFATVLFPHVTTVSPVEAVKTTARVAAVTLGATTVIAVVGFALAVPLLPIIFTESFRPSVQLLAILLLGVVPMSVAKILGNYFAGSRQLEVCLVAAIVGMVVCVSGDLLTIPRSGAVGAAICTSVAYGVFTMMLVVAFVRRSPIPVRELIQAIRSRPKAST
ncbi:MAG: lipopolysaccharide biosynthesis protein [Archangium sp.]